jgi:hypothetical protein
VPMKSCEGSRRPRTFWPLKMGRIGCTETSLQNYHTLRCVISQKSADHIPERALQVILDRFSTHFLEPEGEFSDNLFC